MVSVGQKTVFVYGAQPKKDLIELWKRIVFSMAVTNTDDHLGNHAFILTDNKWALSPLYDVNPVPYGGELSLNVDEVDNSIDVELAVQTAVRFGISKSDAKLYEEGREIAVTFPDLGVATSGTDDDDALLSARELLGCVIYGMEEDGDELPAPTPLSDVELEPGESTALVDVYMPTVRLAQENKAVNRTVTLPAWLNALAVERGVNFSQTMQNAIKSQLGIA